MGHPKFITGVQLAFAMPMPLGICHKIISKPPDPGIDIGLEQNHIGGRIRYIEDGHDY